MITLEFNDTKFKAEFSRRVGVLNNPNGALLNAGRELANRLRKHFGQRDLDDPNRLSDRRSHFWDAVKRSVNQPELEGMGSVSVTISDPRFAQKLFGGMIRAKNADALTLPVEERAYGRTAATFERETGLTLFLVKTGGTKTNGLEGACLAVKDNANSKALTIEYILTKSVDQQADPDALPPKSDLETAILARLQRSIDQQMRTDAKPEQGGTP